MSNDGAFAVLTTTTVGTCSSGWLVVCPLTPSHTLPPPPSCPSRPPTRSSIAYCSEGLYEFPMPACGPDIGFGNTLLLNNTKTTNIGYVPTAWGSTDLSTQWLPPQGQSVMAILCAAAIIIIIIERLSLLQSIPPTTADKQTQAQKRRGSMSKKLLGAKAKSYRPKNYIRLVTRSTDKLAPAGNPPPQLPVQRQLRPVPEEVQL